MRNSRWYLVERAALLSLTVAALVGCGDGAVDVAAPAPARLVAVMPIDYAGIAGGEVSPGPAVRVVDQNGNPLAGVAVVFGRASDEGGIPVFTTIESDLSGIAQLGTWKLGTQAGTQMMTAQLHGLSSVTFSALVVAGPAARMIPVAGDRQLGPSGYALPVPVLVRVIDSYGNPVAGTDVTFAVRMGEGSIAPPLATTTADGQADALWTLGVTGGNSVTASAPGLAAVTFTANATPHVPATYSLRHIVTGSFVNRVPSAIFLAADGSFRMHVQEISGSGTYTIEGTRITFKYSPGFWERMLSEMDIYPMGASTSVEETASIANGILTFTRCYTDECWQASWIYDRVP